MCGTQYDPTAPLPNQIEQCLHNVTTWRDALNIIGAQIGHDTVAQRVVHARLAHADELLKSTHYEVLEVFRSLVAEER